MNNSAMMYNFFHITKTAGMSLTKIVMTHLNKTYLYENNVSLPNNRTRYRNRPLTKSADTDAAKYFTGHLVYYGMHEDIQRPARYILFLRDPVQRMTSLFRHDCIETLRNERPLLSFQEWMQRNLDKTMVHGLTGGSKLTPTAGNAKFILDKMAFIGMQETFASDIKQIFYEDIPIPTENVTQARMDWLGIESLPTLMEEDKTVLNVVLADDNAMYEYARQLIAEGKNEGFKLPLQ